MDSWLGDSGRAGHGGTLRSSISANTSPSPSPTSMTDSQRSRKSPPQRDFLPEEAKALQRLLLQDMLEHQKGAKVLAEKEEELRQEARVLAEKEEELRQEARVLRAREEALDKQHNDDTNMRRADAVDKDRELLRKEREELLEARRLFRKRMEQNLKERQALQDKTQALQDKTQALQEERGQKVKEQLESIVNTSKLSARSAKVCADMQKAAQTGNYTATLNALAGIYHKGTHQHKQASASTRSGTTSEARRHAGVVMDERLHLINEAVADLKGGFQAEMEVKADAKQIEEFAFVTPAPEEAFRDVLFERCSKALSTTTGMEIRKENQPTAARKKRCDITVQSSAGQYLAIFELKLSARAGERQRAVEQTADYATLTNDRIFKSRLGCLGPILVTICVDVVIVNACVMTRDGNGSPVLLVAPLGETNRVYMSKVLAFLERCALEHLSCPMPKDFQVLRAGRCYASNKDVFKIFSFTDSVEKAACQERIAMELELWRVVHRCEATFGEHADDDQGDSGAFVLKLPRITDACPEEQTLEELWDLSKRNMVHGDIRSANIVNNHIIDFDLSLKVGENYSADLNTALCERPSRLWLNNSPGAMRAEPADDYIALIWTRTMQAAAAEPLRVLKKQKQQVIDFLLRKREQGIDAGLQEGVSELSIGGAAAGQGKRRTSVAAIVDEILERIEAEWM